MLQYTSSTVQPIENFKIICSVLQVHRNSLRAPMPRYRLHTVSFDWFLSNLEWILNLEFCLLKLLILYQKLLWNIRSRLDSSTFWDFEPVFEYVWTKCSFFCAQSFNFDQTYLNTGLKTQNVEELSLDLILHNTFW